MKKIITAAILSICVLSSTAYAANFEDTQGHWAAEMINELAESGVVHGVSENEFNPEGTVTRAEFLKMALSAAGIEETDFRSGECLDVTASDWYGPYVQSALDKGLVPDDMIGDFAAKIVETESGSKVIYSGYFMGDEPIKREEMAYITQSVYQYSRDEETMNDMELPIDMHFTDLSHVSSWAFQGVRYAYANDFIAGMSDGTFRPQETATRAQAATIIYNLLKKI